MINEGEVDDDDEITTLPRNMLRRTDLKMSGSSRRERYRSLDETQMLRQHETRHTSKRRMTVIPTSSKLADLSRSSEVDKRIIKC